jgi:hypothetical protein
MTRGTKFLMAVALGLGLAAVITFSAGPRASPWLHTLASLGLLLNLAGAIWIYLRRQELRSRMRVLLAAWALVWMPLTVLAFLRDYWSDEWFQSKVPVLFPAVFFSTLALSMLVAVFGIPWMNASPKSDDS